MTNNEIIFETVRANFTPAQLAELVAATYTAEQIAARRAGVKITVAEGSDETPDAVFHAMLAADTFHTFAEWKRMGYSVKKGQHAALQRKLPGVRLVSVDYDASTGEGTVKSRVRMLLDESMEPSF